METRRIQLEKINDVYCVKRVSAKKHYLKFASLKDFCDYLHRREGVYEIIWVNKEEFRDELDQLLVPPTSRLKQPHKSLLNNNRNIFWLIIKFFISKP